MKNTELLRKLKAVQEQLQIFNDFTELTIYKITENFKKSGEKTYHVCNITMDIMEDRLVLINDVEDLLSMGEDYKSASVFLADYVQAVNMKPINNSEMYYNFEFSDGSIDIYSKPVRKSLMEYSVYNDEVLSEDEEIREIEEVYRRYYQVN